MLLLVFFQISRTSISILGVCSGKKPRISHLKAQPAKKPCLYPRAYLSFCLSGVVGEIRAYIRRVITIGRLLMFFQSLIFKEHKTASVSFARNKPNLRRHSLRQGGFVKYEYHVFSSGPSTQCIIKNGTLAASLPLISTLKTNKGIKKGSISNTNTTRTNICAKPVLGKTA